MHMKQLFLTLFLLPATLLGQDLKKLDQYIEESRKAWNVPGLAIAIVQDDETALAKGYGVTDVETEEKVDENTLFAIASNSKAFTSASLAILVDDGKIEWDDKVTEYLPWFELYDPFVTEQMTVRDLLCHRTGLVTFSGDLIWYGTTHSREEIVRRAKHLQPHFGFREHFGYSNIMYLAAGLVVEEASGMSWDDFVKEHFFEPLGMDRTITSTNDLEGMENVAMPHNDVDGKNIRIDYLNWDNVAPAGSMISSVSDLTNWMKLQLNQGTLDGKEYFSKEQSVQMLAPHTIDHGDDYGRGMRPGQHFNMYGLGWALMDYHGYKVVSHGGGYDGMISKTVLVPELNLGFVILTNNINYMPSALMYQILDAYIRPDEEVDYCGRYLQYKRASDRNKAEEFEARRQMRRADSKPSHDLKDYCGTYHSTIYGDIEITPHKDPKKLNVQFVQTPLFKGELTHWHFDVFEIVLTEVPSLPPGSLQFYMDEDANITGLQVDIPNPDFDFTEFEFKRQE